MSSARMKGASGLGLVALFVAGAAAALGCGWVGTEHSVRFNYWHTEREFSRLPPLPFDARRRTRPDYREDEEGEGDLPTGGPGRAANYIWQQAEAAGLRADFSNLRGLLREYLAAADASHCVGYDAPDNCRQRRNSARDRLDALAALDRGTPAKTVGAYLEARSLYDWLAFGEAVTGARQEPAETKPKSLEAQPGEPADGATPADTTNTASTETANATSAERTAGATSAEQVGAALDAVPRDRNIEDNVAYLRACLLYLGRQNVEAARAFGQLASRHPRSEKREAALFNVGMMSLRESGAFGGEHAADEEACPDCRDAAWAQAVAAFRRVIGEYPRGLYAGDARGWLAYLHVRVGERSEGLAEYYRMLADERDAWARDEAVRSLRLVRWGAGEQEMARVESLVAGEPRVALAYAYHEIYNTALRGGIEPVVAEGANPHGWCKELSGDSNCEARYYEWDHDERERLRRDSGRASLARVAAFATRLMRSRPGAQVGGGFALRVAQADLELGDDKAARELAARALSEGLGGNERASALWVRGVAEQRLGQFEAARRTFTALVAKYPEGDLTEGARRYIAIAAEAAGDLEGALEQYLALRYKEDVAYFVDVLMTPEQLAAFVESHADSPARDMLFYSLGVRYLRAHRFPEARAAYARVRTTDETQGESYFGDGDDRCSDLFPPVDCGEVKNPRWKDVKGVPGAWVLRDLKTMDDLERLEARAAAAADDEAKAEALYALASYLYESGSLTFYNPASWGGSRFYAFYYDQEFRAPGEAGLMRRYMEEHEPLVRALDIYLRVADEYPRTRAARDALYTVAVTHQRLADFQLYWSGQYQQGLHAGPRLVTYADVLRAYPGYRFPSGTYGWEPSTRTVNGHAAWPAPRRPRPLTGMERARLKIKLAERRLAQGWELFGEVYGGRPRGWTIAALRWLLVALLAAFVLFVFRRTRRARRFLYRRLARHLGHAREPRAGAAYAPQSSYAAHFAHVPGERLRAAASQTARGLLRLLLHERGRAALVLNLFTHGLLTVLLWALLWAMRRS